MNLFLDKINYYKDPSWLHFRIWTAYISWSKIMEEKEVNRKTKQIYYSRVIERLVSTVMEVTKVITINFFLGQIEIKMILLYFILCDIFDSITQAQIYLITNGGSWPHIIHIFETINRIFWSYAPTANSVLSPHVSKLYMGSHLFL